MVLLPLHVGWVSIATFDPPALRNRLEELVWHGIPIVYPQLIRTVTFPVHPPRLVTVIVKLAIPPEGIVSVVGDAVNLNGAGRITGGVPSDQSIVKPSTLLTELSTTAQ